MRIEPAHVCEKVPKGSPTGSEFSRLGHFQHMSHPSRRIFSFFGDFLGCAERVLAVLWVHRRGFLIVVLHPPPKCLAFGGGPHYSVSFYLLEGEEADEDAKYRVGKSQFRFWAIRSRGMLDDVRHSGARNGDRQRDTIGGTGRHAKSRAGRLGGWSICRVCIARHQSGTKRHERRLRCFR